MDSKDQTALVAQAVDFVRNVHAGDSSGHDWPHIERVWKLSLRLAQGQDVDLLVVQLAALLHDIADWKFHGGDDSAGPRAAAKWLAEQQAPPALIDHVSQIIASLSFKGANVATPMQTLEGQIVQDADRLDAIGAIGIARAFAYGGHRGRAMYDPSIGPELHGSFAAYKKNAGPTLNHFYEKLLLLPARMNTPAARQLAKERLQFMQTFLQEFLRDWHLDEEPPAWTAF